MKARSLGFEASAYEPPDASPGFERTGLYNYPRACDPSTRYMHHRWRAGEQSNYAAEQRKRQVVMIDDVVAVLWTENCRNHVVAEKAADLLGFSLSQLFLLVSDFVHAYRDLRRPQPLNKDWPENGITNDGHVEDLAARDV